VNSESKKWIPAFAGMTLAAGFTLKGTIDRLRGNDNTFK
jgi:hypothetical protein